MRKQVIPAIVASTVLGAAATLAQRPGERAAGSHAGLELATTVEQVTTEPSGDGAGGSRLVPFAATAGAAVIYTVAFTNTSGRTLENVRITVPLPAELAYVANSASGPGGRALFSIDGGRTFRPPAELAARPEAYTHVRWLLPAPLEAGTRGFVRLRATVKALPDSDFVAVP